jgi:hypothetical protein
MPRYSELGARIAAARASNDRAELRKIKSEITDLFHRVDGDIDEAAKYYGIKRRAFRDIAFDLGLDRCFGLETKPHSELFERTQRAIEECDQKEIAAIEREIFAAIDASGGLIKHGPPERLGIAYSTLTRVIQQLDLTERIYAKFPGKGKAQTLTVRVGGREITRSLQEWSETTGTKRTTIIERLRRGYTPEQAVSPGDFREPPNTRASGRPRRATSSTTAR